MKLNTYTILQLEIWMSESVTECSEVFPPCISSSVRDGELGEGGSGGGR